MKTALQTPFASRIIRNRVSLGTFVTAVTIALAAAVNAQEQPSKEVQLLTGTPSVAEAESPSSAPHSPSAADVQAEQIQKLLLRIEQLEAKEAERAKPAQSLQKTNIDDSPTPQSLDQKIRIIERKNELAAEVAEARAKDAPRLSIGQNGVALSSADTNFVLKLKGVVQLDSRIFFRDNPFSQGNDSFLLRRARPILEGTVFRDFDFQIVPDFGGSSVQLFDANLNYRFRPGLQLKFGKFKGPVGLEQLQSDATLSFNERSLVTDLVPTRNVGVQLWGDIAGGALSYAVGVFNGAGDSRNPANSDFNDNKEIAGRLFLQPFKPFGVAGLEGFGFGLGASYSQVSSNAADALPGATGGTVPGYATEAQQQFFAYNPAFGKVVADGKHWRLSPQANYYYGPFGLLGEYVVTHQGVLNNYNSTVHRAELDHRAWEISGQWVLTGEPASFAGLTPKHPFDLLNGQWGAWQVVARYSRLDIDSATFPNFANPNTSAHSATAWSVGINWWLNKNVRVLTSFTHTIFDGGGLVNPLDATTTVPPGTVNHQNENAFLTRVQLAF